MIVATEPIFYVPWEEVMDHDFCHVEGARRLKQRIEEYWRERGYAIEVKLVEAGFVAAMRSARTDVRSDMVNGLPRKRDDKREPDPVRRPENAYIDNHGVLEPA